MAGIEKVIFMNMCMVYDNEGNVLALDKVGKGYSGTTFPGGDWFCYHLCLLPVHELYGDSV